MGVCFAFNQEERKVDREIGTLYEGGGVKIDRRIMDNGEERLRLVAPGGSAYVRTTAGKSGEWQNSHYHEHTSEFYVVVEGWMALVERLGPDDHVIRVYRPGETVISRPLVHHNVYLPSGAAIDTLKFLVSQFRPGDKESDWYSADPEFDAWTKTLSEQDIAEQAGVRL